MKKEIFMGKTVNVLRFSRYSSSTPPPPFEPDGADRFKTMNGRSFKTSEGLILNVRKEIANG